MASVIDYQSGKTLHGSPSDRLVKASLTAGPSGAVSAYLDEDEWMYVEPPRVADYRRRGVNIITVFVEELP